MFWRSRQSYPFLLHKHLKEWELLQDMPKYECLFESLATYLPRNPTGVAISTFYEYFQPNDKSSDFYQRIGDIFKGFAPL